MHSKKPGFIKILFTTQNLDKIKKNQNTIL